METWYAPQGSLVRFFDISWLGRCGIAISGENPDEVGSLFSALQHAFALPTWEALCDSWYGAKTASQALSAFFDCAAWVFLQNQACHPDILGAEDLWSSVLEHEHPVIRLAGIRTLFLLPAPRRLALLEGREDPENPGLAAWRDHYCQNSADEA